MQLLVKPLPSGAAREAGAESTSGQLLRVRSKRDGIAESDIQEHTLSKGERKKSATIGDDGYPMPDKVHARLALQLINRGGLSAEEKTKVRNKAHKILNDPKHPERVGKASESEIRDSLAEAFASKAQQKWAFSTKQPFAQTWAGKTDFKKIPAKVKVTESQRFAIRLREAIAFDDAKRTADVIIITDGLGNEDDGHYYFVDTIQEAVRSAVFDGAQAFADHPTTEEDVIRPERSIRDLIGYYFDSDITKVADRSGKLRTAYRAKLKIFDGPHYDWIVTIIKESIKHHKMFPDKPPLAGISINADGKIEKGTSPETGAKVDGVRKIDAAFSADMVTKPARGGGFTAIKESQRGSRSTSHQTENNGVSKLLEAATKLEEQISSGEVNGDDLRALVEAARESEKPKDKTKESTDSGDMSEAGKMKGDSKQTDPEDDPEDDDPEDEGADNKESKSKSKAKESEPQATEQEGKESKRTKESARGEITIESIKKSAPHVYSALLKEAERNVKGDVDELRQKVVAFEATDALRESTERAKTLLRESGLPEVAAKRVARMIVGLDEAGQKEVISDEVAYHKSLGLLESRRVEGAGENNGSVKLKESEFRVNAASILAGCSEED
jgi:hypothetical protein